LKPVNSLLVVGTGSAGYRHLLNAKAAGVKDLAVLSTGTGVPAGPLPEDVRVENDLESTLASGISAAVIANPTSLHIDSALAAAKAGCHLLIEKPLSDALTGIKDLKKEVSAQGLVAMVGYHFRFHPSLRMISSWLVQKAIGEIVSANVVWGEYLPGWQPWRNYRTSYASRAQLGGGVLLTLSHPIDYLRWFMGEVVRLDAMTSSRGGLDVDVEDTALVHLEFESGAMASLTLDYVQRPPRHDLSIVGRDGVIHWSNAEGAAVLNAADRQATVPVPQRFERNDLFAAELNHFFDCIDGRSAPSCSVEDGERTLRLCLAAKESAKTGRRIDV
jgi:predicted dehydrogenase